MITFDSATLKSSAFSCVPQEPTPERVQG